MQDLISLICPVYNCEAFLPYCIDAIISQTYKNWELIIIDDGSQDNSLAICHNYAKQDSRIRVLHQEHKGVSAARNYGLETFKGNYILFVDSDDFIEPEHLLNMYDNAKIYDADLSIGSMQVFDVEIGRDITNKYFQKAKTTGVFLSKEKALEYMIYRNGYGGEIAAKLFKSSLIQNLKFDETESIGEDFTFNRQALHIANKIIFIKDFSYHYIRRPGSATRNKAPEIIEKTILVAEKLESFIQKYYPNLEQAKDVFYLNTIFYILHSNLKLPKPDRQMERKYQKLLRVKLKNVLFNKNLNLSFKFQLILLAISVRFYDFIRNIYIYIYIQKFLGFQKTQIKSL